MIHTLVIYLTEEKVMKHVIIFLTLLLLVTSAWSGTLLDNFDDGNMDEWSEMILLSAAG